MQIDDSALDQLEALKTKRIQSIANNGTDFRVLGGNDSTVKGMYSPDSGTVTFPATATVVTGSIITSAKTGTLYIADQHHKAGITVASVLPVIRELETMTRNKLGAYTVSGSVIVVGYKADAIAVPAHRTLPTGTVLKYNDQPLTVSAVRRDGAVSHLTLSPLPAPQKLPEQKHAQPPKCRQTPISPPVTVARF